MFADDLSFSSNSQNESNFKMITLAESK